MIIKSAEVSVRGAQYRGIVTLTLTQAPDGWTYRVEEVRHDGFLLTWRAKTPEGAARKLQDAYPPDVWKLSIKETS